MERIIIKKVNPAFIAAVKQSKADAKARHEAYFQELRQKYLDSGSQLTFHEWVKEYISQNAID